MIINCAEICPRVSGNNFRMPEFAPNYSFRMPLFSFTFLSLQISIKFFSHHICLLRSFPSVSFFSVSLGASVVHLSMLIRKGLSPQSLFVSRTEGRMDGWVDAWGCTDRQPSLTFALSAGVAVVYLCYAPLADG